MKIRCHGCSIPTDGDKIKWILSCFKKIKIYIDWEDFDEDYLDPTIDQHDSALKLIQEEKELKNGIAIEKCFDQFIKHDTIEGYKCDHCKMKGDAKVQSFISRVPDILVIHLKRFNYSHGYFEKIEDVVNFPTNSSLNISKYVDHTNKKKTKTSMGYELFGISNHIMFHTAGGHYTSFIASSNASTAMDEE